MLWVANEEFSEDMQKMGGTEALNEPYLEMPIFKLFKKRVIWLVVLFLAKCLRQQPWVILKMKLQKP